MILFLKKDTRHLFLFTIICLFGICTFGCSKNSSESFSDNAVHIYTWDEPREDPEGKITRVLQDEFDRTHPEVKVHRVSIAAAAGSHRDMRISFISTMVGNKGPDCYHLAYFSYIYLLTRLNMCLPLNTFFEEDSLLDQLEETIMTPATYRGKVYGMPEQVYVMMLVYRKDLFEQVHLDPDRPPRTWEELGRYAQKLTKINSNQYGMALLGMDWASWHWENFVWQAGGEITERMDDGTCRIRFTEAPAIQALQYYKDLRWKYRCVQKDPLQSYESNRRDFVNGTAAMMLLHPGEITFLYDMGLDPAVLGLAPLPAGPAGINAAQIGGGFWIINPTISEAKQKACWEYIKFMTSRESVIKRWQLREKAGLNYPDTPYWKGLKQSDYSKIDSTWIHHVRTSLSEGKMEHFLKDRIAPYLAKAIQAVLVDSLADPKQELDECARRVYREVVLPYNEESRLVQ